MTENEAKGIIKAKLTCMELELLSCIEKGCDKNCESCEYNYTQGNMGKQKESLAVAIKALTEIQQYRKIGTVQGFESALKAMDEYYFAMKEYKAKLKEYEAIGTVEEIQQKMEELDRWHTDKVNEKIKNPFAYTSTLICHNCDHKDEHIEEMEAELEKFNSIGTVEEFKYLKEKNEPRQNPSREELLAELQELSKMKMILECYQSIGTVDECRVAVERMKPKKATFVDTRFRHHGKNISDGCSIAKCYKCPNCNSHIFHVFDSELHCQKCGQAINWSE